VLKYIFGFKGETIKEMVISWRRSKNLILFIKYSQYIGDHIEEDEVIWACRPHEVVRLTKSMELSTTREATR
jgi:hypothetical protein